MFTQDLDATVSYRTLARGFGCRWARTYQSSLRDHAPRNPQASELVRSRPLGATTEAIARRVR